MLHDARLFVVILILLGIVGAFHPRAAWIFVAAFFCGTLLGMK